MTKEQIELVRNLRLELLRTGYPSVYAVDNQTLEAVEANLIEWLEENNQPSILKCGKHGVFFKGVELVLKAEK